MAGKYAVHVVNNIYPVSSSPLLLHCASGNDELGNHQLYHHQDFHWSFCEQIFHRTLFFCRFRWGSKNIAFEVFNTTSLSVCKHSCYWEAHADGVYFSGDYPRIGLAKMYPW
ncbi:hypothetical protein PHJA_001431300 [Phtheirospermum japonicum]|uniref:S-protein homolog n=1 Tax=Phtheirospermum japonicum TaxID=374723 RepID=A0A830BZI6_9LAMI|nr:hypothetical protein PHJA_001431300 [Phtheirospermum japonicum]